MAPQVGLEPTTLRLTAGCSAIELLRSIFGARPEGAASFFVIHNIIGGGCGDFKVARDSAQLWRGLFLRRLIRVPHNSLRTRLTPHIYIPQ